jgi:cytoskeletal protein CcmA (bactofilin family)
MYENEQQKQAYKATKARIKADKKAFKAGVKTKDGAVGGMGNVTESDGERYIEGVINMGGGKFEKLFIDGVLNVNGDISAELIDVDGVGNFKGDVDVNDFSCDGTLNMTGSLKATKVMVDGAASIKGKLESDEITCNGAIKVVGELSTDKLYADGIVKADQIVGDEIVIRNKYSNKWIAKLLNLNYKGKLIEATTIYIEKFEVERVNGQDIKIGPKCKVAHIDCSGTLFVDPTAEVGEITGDYEKVGA